jgi:hypothetical protein
MGQTHLHLEPSIRANCGPMRKLSVIGTIGICLISALLVQTSAASASSPDSCQAQTRLGGGKDRAVLVGVTCQGLVLETAVTSKSSTLVPFRNSWSAEGAAEDSCRGKKKTSHCRALIPINEEPSKIWSAYRVEGNRCAPLSVLIVFEERCTGTVPCLGSGTFEHLRLPRPEGCP